MTELGKFVFVSCSEKKKEQEALDKEIRGCPGYSSVERDDKGSNREIWRGKMNRINYNPNKRKEDFKEIINSYNQFKSEKAGEYSTKYLKNLSDLLYKTKKIDYVTQRKILVKSKKALNNKTEGNKKSKRNIKPIYVTRNQKKDIKPNKANNQHIPNRFKININYTNRHNCFFSERIRADLNDSDDSGESEVRLKEPDIEYDKDGLNYTKLLYVEIKKKWSTFYSVTNKSNTRTGTARNKIACHSKSFGIRPDNIDQLLRISYNRYPAKEHFFKVLHLRKNTQNTPMSTAYSSFPHFSKTCFTSN